MSFFFAGKLMQFPMSGRKYSILTTNESKTKRHSVETKKFAIFRPKFADLLVSAITTMRKKVISLAFLISEIKVWHVKLYELDLPHTKTNLFFSFKMLLPLVYLSLLLTFLCFPQSVLRILVIEARCLFSRHS